MSCSWLGEAGPAPLLPYTLLLTDAACVLQLDLQHLHGGGHDHLAGACPTAGQHLLRQGQLLPAVERPPAVRRHVGELPAPRLPAEGVQVGVGGGACGSLRVPQPKRQMACRAGEGSGVVLSGK